MDDSNNKNTISNGEVEEEHIKLDYSIESAAERTELVKKIVGEADPKSLTPRYLEILADYIIFAATKEEKKQKKILTPNRMVTINKRETSYQNLVNHFEGGEDAVYNLITNDKNIILSPKVSITEEDLETISPLRDLKGAIEVVECDEAKATGKRKYLLKKQLIQMKQDQYVIKNEYKQPMYAQNLIKSFSKVELGETVTMQKDKPVSDGYVSFFNPEHISLLLRNYIKLKEDSWGNFMNDTYYLMEDFDKLINDALKEKYSMFLDIVIYKIDDKSSTEIQEMLLEKYKVSYSIEYISKIWRHKIPEVIAEKASEDYIIWHYQEKEKGQWKRCSRCREYKLANNIFFSRNSSSKDGFYSICKKCRNKK